MQKLLKDHRAKIILWVIGAIFIGFWADAAWRNSLHVLERSVHVSFERYKEALIQRASILPPIIQLLKNAAPQEQALAQELIQNYEYAMRYLPPEQMLSEAKLAAEYTQLQTAIVISMIKVQKMAHNYPALEKNQEYDELIDKWNYLNILVASQEGILNKYISLYNHHIDDFPINVYNKIFYRYSLKIPSKIPTTG